MDISKLPPELQRAAQLHYATEMSEEEYDFLQDALPLALTYCLQMQEDKEDVYADYQDAVKRLNAAEAQLSRIAETVAKLPSITGLQEGCVKDHSLIWMAIRDAQDAYRDTLKRHQRDAQQHAKRAETAEATIATLTRALQTYNDAAILLTDRQLIDNQALITAIVNGRAALEGRK